MTTTLSPGDGVNVSINSGIYSQPDNLGAYGIVIGFEFTTDDGTTKSIELFSDPMFNEEAAPKVVGLIQRAILASRPPDSLVEAVEADSVEDGAE